MTVPACSNCRNCIGCVRNGIVYGSDQCWPNMKTPSKGKPKANAKPKPAPVKKTNVEIGLGAVEDFVRKGLSFFE